MLKILTLLFLLAAPFDVVLHGGSKTQGSQGGAVVNVAANQYHNDKRIRELVTAGLEVKFRFKIQLCHRGGWIDNCYDRRLHISKIAKDSLSGNFKVTLDRFYDDKQPISRTYESYDEAIQASTSVEDLSAAYLTDNKDPLIFKKGAKATRNYIRIRLTTSCKEADRDVGDWISYLMSFGGVDTRDEDTGWVEYDL